ncbi:hypothetical protein [Paenibacillus sp. GP183]|uniref:hypothetical protein n=1 Tax=Paenibacillus sp. GP183 TaxID=1882751 RepID=UPI000B83294F|nr:hypothetical protein [Paenibacillus sp. GP183]
MMKKHPYFGHTLSRDLNPQQIHPLSLKAPIVHVKAVIKKVEVDGESADGMHQHLLVNQIVVIEIRGAETSLVSDEAFVAIRYGDAEGIPGRIAGFAEGQPIELQGEYIDVNHAHKGVGNPGDSVIHFTHHPIGFVLYQGVRYE